MSHTELCVASLSLWISLSISCLSTFLLPSHSPWQVLQNKEGRSIPEGLPHPKSTQRGACAVQNAVAMLSLRPLFSKNTVGSWHERKLWPLTAQKTLLPPFPAQWKPVWSQESYRSSVLWLNHRPGESRCFPNTLGRHCPWPWALV